MIGLSKRSGNMKSQEGRASQKHQQHCMLNEGQRQEEMFHMDISQGGVEGLVCGETKRQEHTNQEQMRLIMKNTALAKSHCAYTPETFLYNQVRDLNFLDLLKF